MCLNIHLVQLLSHIWIRSPHVPDAAPLPADPTVPHLTLLMHTGTHLSSALAALQAGRQTYYIPSLNVTQAHVKYVSFVNNFKV